VPDQPRLAPSRALRARPARLDPPARARRRPRHRRTETAPLLPPPHRRPHRSHQPTDHLPARRQLALDTRTRHRVRPRPPAPAALLNNTTAGPPAAAAPTQPTKGQPPPALTWTSHAPASTQPQQRSEYETEAPTTQHSNRYRTAWASRLRTL